MECVCIGKRWQNSNTQKGIYVTSTFIDTNDLITYNLQNKVELEERLLFPLPFGGYYLYTTYNQCSIKSSH